MPRLQLRVNDWVVSGCHHWRKIFSWVKRPFFIISILFIKSNFWLRSSCGCCVSLPILWGKLSTIRMGIWDVPSGLQKCWSENGDNFYPKFNENLAFVTWMPMVNSEHIFACGFYFRFRLQKLWKVLSVLLVRDAISASIKFFQPELQLLGNWGLSQSMEVFEVGGGSKYNQGRVFARLIEFVS